MTIIEPYKTKIQPYFVIFAVLLIIASFSGIRFYNSNVNFRFRLSVQERTLQQLEAANGDLRNKIFQKVDEKNAAALILEHNLISDRAPVYIEHEGLANL